MLKNGVTFKYGGIFGGIKLNSIFESLSTTDLQPLVWFTPFRPN